MSFEIGLDAALRFVVKSIFTISASCSVTFSSLGAFLVARLFGGRLEKKIRKIVWENACYVDLRITEQPLSNKPKTKTILLQPSTNQNTTCL
jgi:hypothetical protein